MSWSNMGCSKFVQAEHSTVLVEQDLWVFPQQIVTLEQENGEYVLAL
jgi:hypothetical protein